VCLECPDREWFGGGGGWVEQWPGNLGNSLNCNEPRNMSEGELSLL
jgi:hypothetical protein